jgi:signal transduction histidine kinase
MNPYAAFRALLGCLALSFFTLASAVAAEAGTAAEAEAMVRRAVAYIKAQGPDKAYEEFINGKSFKDRDLYISVYDLNGKNLAHGVNPRLVGKDMMGLKDPDGKPIIKMITDVARDKGRGWTEPYKFMNPLTQKVQSKVIYVERLADTAIGVGIYKD